MELVNGQLYRLHYMMEEPELRGKVVTLQETRVFVQGDVPRCRVVLVSDNRELLVRRDCLIKL